MKRHVSLFLAVLFLWVGQMAQGQERNIISDYDEALARARKENYKNILIFFQKDGKPEIPWQTLGKKLEKYVILQIPTDYRLTEGGLLIESPALEDLKRGPGVVLNEWTNQNLYCTKVLRLSDFSDEVFERTFFPRPQAFELLPSARLQALKAILPKVADEKFQSILDDGSTLWYDEHSLPPVYQDATPPILGLRSPNGDIARGQAAIFQNGKFFFPFGHTGGTHRVTNIALTNFLSLPKKSSGELWPVVYWRNGYLYQWVFPKGTVVGEVLAQYSPSNQKVVFEIRTRTKSDKMWVVNSYRPFPTAAELADAIEKEKPEWKESKPLVTLVNHLRDQNAFHSATLEDRFGTLYASGGVDELPPMGADLVTSLLRKTPFRSALGEQWKKKGKAEVYAPTIKSGYSIVPAHFDAGTLEVSSHSCRQCHRDAGRNIGDFIPNEVLYGQIWGSDQTFSWHPFDVTFVNDGNNGNWGVRQSFVNAGIVAEFSSTRHPGDIYYQVTRDPKRRN